MQRCLECGTADVVPYLRGVRIDPRGLEFEELVPASRCLDCGRVFAIDDVVREPAKYGARPVRKCETL